MNDATLVAAVLCTLCVLACNNPTAYTGELGPGVQYFSSQSESGRYHEVLVDLELAQCTMHWKDINGAPLKTIAALRAYLQANNTEPLFLTNGGIYQPDLTPGGLYIENGDTLHPLNLNDGGGNFHLKPNGVFAIEGTTAYVVDSTEYETLNLKPDYAVQSGPLLVKNGEIHPAFNPESESRHIRSGVGIQPNGSLLFALSHQPVTLYEFAKFFQHDRNIDNALYLDGAISTFQYKDRVRPVVKGPNPTQPTPYATMIAVSPRKK